MRGMVGSSGMGVMNGCRVERAGRLVFQEGAQRFHEAGECDVRFRQVRRPGLLPLEGDVVIVAD